MWHFLDKHFEELLGSIMLAVMALIAFANVIVRYCTTFSLAWTEEITINFFVWVVLLGTACAFRDSTNLGMSILYSALPRTWRKLSYWLGILLCFVFFGALCWTGVLEVIDEIDLESQSESLGIPVWWYTIATPVFSLLIIFRMAQRSFKDLRSGNF